MQTEPVVTLTAPEANVGPPAHHSRRDCHSIGRGGGSTVLSFGAPFHLVSVSTRRIAIVAAA